MEVVTKPKIALSEATDEALISKFVEIRDRRAQRKKEYQEADAEDKRRAEKLEAELLRRLNERGTDSTSSRKHGTAYRLTQTSCTVADWETFFHHFVLPNNNWDFLERRASKSAVEAYRNEHDDLPPGLNWKEIATIGVKRG